MAATSSRTEPSSASTDVFRRLARTISGRTRSESLQAQDVQQEQQQQQRQRQQQEQHHLELERTQSSTSSSSRNNNKLKGIVGNKLWRIGQDRLPLKFKSRLASPRVSEGDLPADTNTNTDTDVHVHGRTLSTVAEQPNGLPSPPPTEASSSSSTPTSTSTPTPTPTTPSPATLAQRLRDLIDPLPFPTFSAPIKPPKLAPRDERGRPIAPPSAVVRAGHDDERLLALLASATFMNGGAPGPGGDGDQDEDGDGDGDNDDDDDDDEKKKKKKKPGRTSIWEILESLGSPPHGFPEPHDDDEGGPPAGPSAPPPDDGGGGGDEPRYAGTSSVMLYSPLIPGREDMVELGELLPISLIEEELARAAASFRGGGGGDALKGWTSVWPLSLIAGWARSNAADDQVVAAAAAVEASEASESFSKDFYVYSDVTSTDALGRTVRLTSTSAWVPSTTKLSFQVMWWGYRLWLPPPVMDVLSDQTLEAAKRASLIATALAWFFNNLPVAAFPVQVRPALLLMQRIVPYLGYIATFISWSWGTIKGYDLGHGVTLTATWLLPIALIPGSWFDRDVPKSPTQSPPPNLPNSPTTMPTTTPTPTPITSPPTSSTPTQPPPSQTPTTSPPPPTAPSQPDPANPPVQATPPATQPAPQPTPAIPSPPAEPPPPPPPPVTVPVTPPTTPGSSSSSSTIAPNDPIATTIPPTRGGPFVLDPFSSPKSLAKKLFSDVPVPPSPRDVPPVPPVPAPRTPVKVGSELGEKLLHAPVLRVVPLPSEGEEGEGEGEGEEVVVLRSKGKEKEKEKEKVRMKKKMKAFFGKGVVVDS